MTERIVSRSHVERERISFAAIGDVDDLVRALQASKRWRWEAEVSEPDVESVESEAA